jgi:uncharacterized protein
MMHTYINRKIEKTVVDYLKSFPAVAILGPRQAGKSTLAKHIIKNMIHSVYLDLERPSDAQKLIEPEMYFDLHKNHVICLDEIQKTPDIFSILRSVIDEQDRNGQFLIIGSASRDLIKQTSESLAGRIAFLELNPFSIDEIVPLQRENTLQNYWIRGGFPRSYLSKSDGISTTWLDNLIRTFLERDIPQLGFRIPAESIRRLWQICAHQHGQLLNLSVIGQALGTSHTTIRSYIDVLTQTFMLRTLPPIILNVKKRLVKSPKIYLRDTGILHTLLGIKNMDDLLGHPVYGFSWEGMVLENILQKFPTWRAGFYRTSAGAELDLVLEKGTKRIGIECKASVSPQVTRGFWNAINDLALSQVYVIAPVRESYPLNKNVFVISLPELLEKSID